MLSLLSLFFLASEAYVLDLPHHAQLRDEISSPVVDLEYAKYRGERLGDADVDQYLGMRYAAPPLGDLRFRAPRDPIPESGVQNASSVNLNHILYHVQ